MSNVEQHPGEHLVLAATVTQQLPDGYRGLLIYGKTILWGAPDEPENVAWVASLRQRAAADGLAVVDGALLNMAGWEDTVVELTRGDGSWPHPDLPPFWQEEDWGEILDAARCRAQVGRYAPLPPVELRRDLTQIYERGYLPLPDEGETMERFWPLHAASWPTGVPVKRRAVGDAVWREQVMAGGPTERGPVKALRFLSIVRPGYSDYELRDLDRRQLAPALARLREQMEADWGERLEWVRGWARGESARPRAS